MALMEIKGKLPKLWCVVLHWMIAFLEAGGSPASYSGWQMGCNDASGSHGEWRQQAMQDEKPGGGRGFRDGADYRIQAIRACFSSCR